MIFRQIFDKKNREGGFIKYIMLFIIFAGLLVYFGIDVRGLVENHPEIFDFFHEVGTFALHIWFTYIYPFFNWIWGFIPAS